MQDRASGPFSRVSSAARCTAPRCRWVRRHTRRQSSLATTARPCSTEPPSLAGQRRSKRLDTPLRLVTSADTATLSGYFTSEVHTVSFALSLYQPSLESLAQLGEDRLQPHDGVAVEDLAPVLGDEEPIARVCQRHGAWCWRRSESALLWRSRRAFWRPRTRMTPHAGAWSACSSRRMYPARIKEGGRGPVRGAGRSGARRA